MQIYSYGCDVSTGTFYPAYSIISAISLGGQTTVTFSSPHDFTVGEIISFRVSRQYGTVELNNQEVLVQSVTTDAITVDIDSTYYTVFDANPDAPATLAMVVPSASGVIPGSVPIQTSLIDVFDHIPPS